MNRRPMRTTTCAGMVIFAALFACKKEETATTAAPPPTAAPVPTPEAPKEPEEKIADFRGSYVTNWGKAKCTQVKRNVNCLYAGKSGGMDCKVVGEDALDCDWEETNASGKSRLTRKDDGKLVGTWGNGESYTNGGPWIFKPTSD